MEPILQVKELTTELSVGGRTVSVVEGLTFDLWAGRTLALVGESGCGKSMAALSLMRLVPSPPVVRSTGEVLYQGRNLLKVSESEMRGLRGSRLAMIFQDPSGALNPVYTIGDQLVEVVELHLQRYGDEAIELAIKALRDVGIGAPERRLRDYPHQLSGGMCQRVMIAMALICRPEVLIADEPTTALDVTIQAQVLELMRSLQKEFGMALLLITHDMGVVAEVADDVIVMYAGKAVEFGNVVSIFDKGAHPYTKALFAARPTLERRHERLQAIQGTVPGLGQYPKGCRFHPRCPQAMEICKEGVVPRFAVLGSSDHLADCWLLDPAVIQLKAISLGVQDKTVSAGRGEDER